MLGYDYPETLVAWTEVERTQAVNNTIVNRYAPPPQPPAGPPPAGPPPDAGQILGQEQFPQGVIPVLLGQGVPPDLPSMLFRLPTSSDNVALTAVEFSLATAVNGVCGSRLSATWLFLTSTSTPSWVIPRRPLTAIGLPGPTLQEHSSYPRAQSPCAKTAGTPRTISSMVESSSRTRCFSISRMISGWETRPRW